MLSVGIDAVLHDTDCCYGALKKGHMKTPIRNLMATIAGIALLCGCHTPQTNSKAWEYKVVEKNLYPGVLEKQINELAKDGWSLVTVSTTSIGENTVPQGFIVVRRHTAQ
jgi:hypothetical protein